MMSYQSIASLRAEAAATARAENLVPQLVTEVLQEYKHTGRFTFPSLGYYVPTGWELSQQIEHLLVDKTGRGREGELALTVQQFVQRLESFAKSGDPYAVAIIEEGEMQIVVGIFVPDRRDFTRSGKLTQQDLDQLTPRTF